MGQKSSSSSFWYSSRSRSSSAPATPRPEPAEPPIGCMSMVHYLIFAPGAGCVGRPPTSSNAVVMPHDCRSVAGDSHRQCDGSGSKSGFEAPRNSLDLDADNPNDIQIGVQIEPVFDALASRTTSMRRSTKPTAPSSEAETPRTPSLVARLMGIDGLPDQHPSSSPAPAQQHKKPSRRSTTTSTAGAGKENSSSCCSPPAASKGGEKKKRVIPESMNRREPLRSLSCNVAGEARSLPDTPRASTSARASWDGPRLSLQALKENVLDRAAQYMSMPSSPTSLSSSSGKKKKDGASSHRRRRDDERAAAKEHAREILRQAKEMVASRKSGSGKNTASSSPAVEKRQSRFDNKENVVMSSPAAAPAPAMEDASKLRVVVQVQQNAKPTTTVAPKPTSAEHHHSPRVALAPTQQQQPSPPPPHRAKPSRPPPPPPPLDPPRTRARKPDGCERFATRMKKPAAACPASAPPTSSSPSTTTECCSVVATRHAGVLSSSPLEEDPEYRYLRTVLERGGFTRSSPPPRRPWRGHSVASPVDPIVFHLLELELPTDETRLGPLRHRWNRKLLFHLAQELLADLLLGLDAASSTSTATTTGLPLLGKVWRKVRSFPAANCRVVGDIDALVATDLELANVRRLARHPAVEEEASDVAEEVADRVLDALLAECVAEESVPLSCSAAHARSSLSRAAAR